MVRPARLERATSWFVARRSIQLSYGRVMFDPGALSPGIAFASWGPFRPTRYGDRPLSLT